jgi:hypothetical protein
MLKKDVLIQFKTALTLFLDELIVQFPLEGDLVICRIFMKDQIPIETVMTNFVHKIMPLKHMVTSRDEDFFLNHCTILDTGTGVSQGKISRFKTLWRSESLDADDRHIVWQWFDSFVLIAEKYQKCFK